MITKKFEINDEVVAINASAMDIAKIQIESAIEMLFQGHHPVAVHAVAQAGFQIVRDLGTKKDLETLKSLEEANSPLWSKVSSPWSFKESGENQFPGMKQELNEFAIFWAIHFYVCLGGKTTPAMRTMFLIVASKYPEICAETIPQLTSEVTHTAKNLSREQMLTFGAAAIENARKKVQSSSAEMMQ